MDKHLLRRRLAQWLALLVLVVTPLAGILRLDIPTRSVIVLGRNLWFQESYLVIIGILFLFFLLVSLIKILGRVPCGWACPRNFVLEAVDRLIGPKGAPWSRKLPGIPLLLVFSLAFGVIALSYFYDWRYLLRELYEFNGSSALVWTLALAAVAFLDLLFVRHAFCYTGCPYGLMQNILGDEKTMRLHFDPAACVHCDGCTQACFMDIDPRTDARSICVACGDCITACEKALRQDGLSALSFAYGSRDHFPLGQVLKDSRFLFMAGVTLLLAGSFIYGVFSHAPIAVAMSKIYSKTESSITVQDNLGVNRFQVIVNNSTGMEKRLTLSVEGLDSRYVELEQNPVTVGPGQDVPVRLTVKVPLGAIPAGAFVPFTVKVVGDDPRDPAASIDNVFYMPQSQ